MYLSVEIGDETSPYGTDQQLFGRINGLITIIQKFNHHDLAEIRIPLRDRSMGSWATGDPVRIYWSSSPGVDQTWVGYVHSVEDTLPRGGTYRVAVVVALGATYPMKTQRQVNWGQPTLRALVEEIAERHNFRAVIPDFTPRIRYPVNQSGESDWTLLVKSVAKTGMLLYVDQTTLFVRHPLKAIHRDRPTVSYNSADLAAVDGEISDDLEGNDSQTSTRMGLVMGGINIGDVQRAPMPSPVSRIEIVTPAGSYGEASLRVAGRQPWGARSKVSPRLYGSAAMRVGSLVEIAQGNRASGLWLVEEIVHIIGAASVKVSATPRLRVRLGLVKPAQGMGFLLDDQSQPGVSSGSVMIGGKWRAKV